MTNVSISNVISENMVYTLLVRQVCQHAAAGDTAHMD